MTINLMKLREGEDIMMTINGILNSRSLYELVCAAEEFCQKNIIRENDDVCMKLKEQLEISAENDYLTLLSSYVVAAEDGDEVIEALYEFVENCKDFVEADEDMTHQVTKEEFETILDECQTKCSVLDCINESNIMNPIEVPYYSQHRETCVQIKNNVINLFLPKIDINKNTREYIAEEIGTILYNILLTKLDMEYIRHEMNRYIPETREKNDIKTNELFKDYFYNVVLYKERKPGIYPVFDDHMRRVIILGFFKRIIDEYLNEKMLD